MKLSLICIFFGLGLSMNLYAGTYKGDCQQLSCPEKYCSHCQCTDNGYYWNDCLSKKTFCEAFGNVGAR